VILIFAAAALVGAIVSVPLLKQARGVSPDRLERVERFAAATIFPLLLLAAFWVTLGLYAADYLRVLGIVAALPILVTLLVVLRRGGAHWRRLPQIAAGVTLLAVAGSEAVLANAAAGGPPAKYPALLTKLAGPRALGGLAASLQDNDPQIRIQAAQELLTLGPVAAPVLGTALEDRELTVRRCAAAAVAKAPEPRHQAVLCRMLRDSDKEIRGSAVSALGRLADPASVPALVAALAEQTDPVGERTQLGDALGRMEHRLIPALRPFLTDESPAIRIAAVEALGRGWKGPATLALLEVAPKDPDGRVRAAAFKQAANTAWTIRNSDIDRLAGLENGGSVYNSASGFVDQNLVLKVLAVGTRDQDPLARLAATHGIEQVWSADARRSKELRIDLKDPENGLWPVNYQPAFDAVAARLQDPDVGVRKAAAEALKSRPDRLSAPALIQALSRESDSMIVPILAEALGDAGDARAIPVLRSMDARHSTNQYCELCKALYKLGVRSGLRHGILIVRGK
jgi:HEAT repeat protein